LTVSQLFRREEISLRLLHWFIRAAASDGFGYNIPPERESAAPPPPQLRRRRCSPPRDGGRLRETNRARAGPVATQTGRRI
jgi:hypothetical protein